MWETGKALIKQSLFSPCCFRWAERPKTSRRCCYCRRCHRQIPRPTLLTSCKLNDTDEVITWCSAASTLISAHVVLSAENVGFTLKGIHTKAFTVRIAKKVLALWIRNGFTRGWKRFKSWVALCPSMKPFEGFPVPILYSFVESAHREKHIQKCWSKADQKVRNPRFGQKFWSVHGAGILHSSFWYCRVPKGAR